MSDDEGDIHDGDQVREDDLFDREGHIRYLEMNYHILPSPYESQEINHLTLSYFIISGLHILHALDRIDKEAVIGWILSLQAHPKNEDDLNDGKFYGFHGSKSSQFRSVDNAVAVPNNSHLASTYCALAILKIVDYDFSLIDSSSISKSMKHLQQSDGSFMPIHTGAETDLRFVYCAAVISSLLDNWSGIDKEKAKNYILSCQSYDGGFGLLPGQESHGGATYCAVASLRLMGFIEDDLVSKCTSSCILDIPLLLDWCLQRQAVDGGFQGRPNKVSDTCYAFWIGGVLKVLGAYNLINEKSLRDFLLTCQSQVKSSSFVLTLFFIIYLNKCIGKFYYASTLLPIRPPVPTNIDRLSHHKVMTLLLVSWVETSSSKHIDCEVLSFTINMLKTC